MKMAGQARARSYYNTRCFDKTYLLMFYWLIVCCSSGLHEEVDYSEKLKFSDDEEDRMPCEKNKIW